MDASIKREALLLWIVIASILILTNAGFDTSEGMGHYEVALQIVTHGSLGFAEPRAGIYAAAPNGRTYASHEIGNTLFLIPVAAMNALIEQHIPGRSSERRHDYVIHFIVSFMPVMYCSVTAILVFVMLRTVFGRRAREAAFCALVLILCTFVWTYSRNLFDGVLCMAILAGATLCLFTYVKTANINVFIWGAILFGFGFITRATMALPILAASTYLAFVFRRTPKRLVTVMMVGLVVIAPFVLWQLFYNHLRTGSMMIFPIQTARYADNNALDGNFGTGMMGLLFSPGKSIFVYCPVALLSVFCVREFCRRHPAEGIFVGCLSIAWLLLHAKMRNWSGDWGWGPRYFVTLSPVLSLPFFTSGSTVFKERAGRVLVGTALGFGFILGAASIVGNWHERMGVAASDRIWPGWHWSIERNQATDMLRVAIENLHRVVTKTPVRALSGLSAPDAYASSTINVWWNTAAFMGIPKIDLFAAFLFFSISGAIAGRRFWTCTQPAAAERPVLIGVAASVRCGEN